jgi:hypothetical protein
MGHVPPDLGVVEQRAEAIRIPRRPWAQTDALAATAFRRVLHGWPAGPRRIVVAIDIVDDTVGQAPHLHGIEDQAFADTAARFRLPRAERPSRPDQVVAVFATRFHRGVHRFTFEAVLAIMFIPAKISK